MVQWLREPVVGSQVRQLAAGLGAVSEKQQLAHSGVQRMVGVHPKHPRASAGFVDKEASLGETVHLPQHFRLRLLRHLG